MSETTLTLNKVAEFVAGKTTATAPTVYIGLSTTTPVTAGTGATEPSTGSYARVSAPGTSWATASGGVTSNSVAITFPTATASQGTVTYVVAYDASTAGNLLWFAPLTTSQAIASGNTASFAIGALTITQT